MRDYILLLFVVGLVPFILYRAWIGAIAWTWIGLMNPHLFTWELSEFPFAQVIGLSFMASWVISPQKRMVPLSPGFLAMCVLLLFVTVKNPFAWNQDVAWDLWKQYVKIVMAAIMIAAVIYTPYRIRWFLWTILFSIGVFYGVRGGLFALATGGNWRVQGPEPSFIGGNTHLGVAMLMVAPLFLAFMKDPPNRWKWWPLLGLGGFWLSMMAVLFTYSRGAWLGLAAVAGLLFLQTRRKLLVLAVLIPIGMVAVAFIPDKLFDRVDTIGEYKEDTSALQRLQGWGVAWNVAMRHPLGSGFVLDATPVPIWMSYANFEHPLFNRANAAHSIYFQVLGDHGFGGLGLFLFMIIGTFWTLVRVRQLTRWDKDRVWISHYATALAIGLVGYSISGAFVSMASFDLLYTYVILAAVLLREVKTQTAESRAPAAVVKADGGAGRGHGGAVT
jgi:probable O-glycosylation ligase (exosortase A-associated)